MTVTRSQTQHLRLQGRQAGAEPFGQDQDADSDHENQGDAASNDTPDVSDDNADVEDSNGSSRRSGVISERADDRDALERSETDDERRPQGNMSSHYQDRELEYDQLRQLMEEMAQTHARQMQDIQEQLAAAREAVIQSRQDESSSPATRRALRFGVDDSVGGISRSPTQSPAVTNAISRATSDSATTTSRRAKPHAVGMPYKFTGKDESTQPDQIMDAESWLDMFVHLCALTDPNEDAMTDNQRLRALFKKGPALAMALAEGDGADYTTVMRRLRTMYTRHDMAGNSLDRFNDLRQQAHQKVEDFHIEFSLAYAKVRRASKQQFEMSSSLLAQKFRDALHGPIAEALGMFSEIENYEEMVAKAMSIERSRARQRSSRPAARVAFAHEDARTRHTGADRPSRGYASGPLRRPVRCWNCNAEGHVARNCPDPLERAFQYADPERRARDAPRSFQGKPEARINRNAKFSYAALPMQTNGDLYVLELCLGGESLLALIDSEASANFVNEGALPNSAEINIEERMMVQGFDGNQTKTLGSITSDMEALSNSGQFKSVKLHVVAHSPFPIVLETPFLRQFRLVIDLNEEVLTDANGGQFPIVRVSGDIGYECGNAADAQQAAETPWRPSDDVTLCGTPAEIEQLKKLIDEHFPDCFDCGDSHVGAITDKIGIYHYIDTGDARPYVRPPIRISPQERAMTREYLDEKLESGAISPAPPGTEWAAPVLLVKKPGGGMRFCQDYRGLNSRDDADRIIRTGKDPRPTGPEEPRQIVDTQDFDRCDDIDLNEPDVFEVEKLLRRRVRKGREEYLIRWKNQDSTYDTWESVANINQAALDDFEQGRSTPKRLANMGVGLQE